MEHDDSTAEAARSGVATNVIEAVVAAILLVVGIVVIVESRRLGSGWTTDGPGSGYFPFYIGLIIVISSLGLLYQSLLSKKRDTRIFVDSVNSVQQTSFDVRSDKPVAVTAYFTTIHGTEAYTPLPVDRWGREYFAASLNQWLIYNDDPFEFDIERALLSLYKPRADFVTRAADTLQNNGVDVGQPLGARAARRMCIGD